MVGHSRIDLSQHPADFIALSFYKMFGYPTGLGALLVRNGIPPAATTTTTTLYHNNNDILLCVSKSFLTRLFLLLFPAFFLCFRYMHILPYNRFSISSSEDILWRGNSNSINERKWGTLSSIENWNIYAIWRWYITLSQYIIFEVWIWHIGSPEIREDWKVCITFDLSLHSPSDLNYVYIDTNSHIHCLVAYLYQRLSSLTHSNGQPVCEMYVSHDVNDPKQQVFYPFSSLLCISQPILTSYLHLFAI